MSDSCCQHHSPDPGADAAKAPAFGVENPASLDAMALDNETGEIVLIMVEPRPWDGSEERLFQLQEKLNAYLSFALDGELFDAFPQLTGKPIRVQLDCAETPDPVIGHFIHNIREHLAVQEMKFAVRIVGEPMPPGAMVAESAESGGCGTGCGCHPGPGV